MVKVDLLLDFSTKCYEFAESPIWSRSPLAQEDEAHPTVLPVGRARGIISDCALNAQVHPFGLALSMTVETHSSLLATSYYDIGTSEKLANARSNY